MIPTKNLLNKLTAAAKSVDLDVNLKEYYARKPPVPKQVSRTTTPKVSRSTVTSSSSHTRSRPPVSPKLTTLAHRQLTPPPSSRTPRATSPTVASLSRQSDGTARLHARIRELEKQNAQLESTVLYHLRTMETTQRESEALHVFVRQLKTLLSASDREVFLSDVVADLSGVLHQCGCSELVASLARKVIPAASESFATPPPPPTALVVPASPEEIPEKPRAAAPRPAQPARPVRPASMGGSWIEETQGKRVQEIMDLIMNRRSI